MFSDIWKYKDCLVFFILLLDVRWWIVRICLWYNSWIICLCVFVDFYWYVLFYWMFYLLKVLKFCIIKMFDKSLSICKFLYNLF